MIRLSQPTFREEELTAVMKVLQSGMLVQGQRVQEFEKSLQEYMGTPFVAAVSSGTAALHLAVEALGIGQGDAVLVPAFTFPATANVVELAGARTVMVDVELETYTIDLQKLEEAIMSWKGPEKLKAIIVVHEFGAPVNMGQVIEIATKYNLRVIEDAACGLGAKWNGQHVGTFGEVGCFSWHPRKAITTGEGGAVTVQDEDLMKVMGQLRNHGMERMADGTSDFVRPGYNYRLTEFQAVLGSGQLSYFNSHLDDRRRIAEQYLIDLFNEQEIGLPFYAPGHAWQTFMIRLPVEIDRKKIIERLKNNGIESNMGAQALHMLTYYKEKYGYEEHQFPCSAQLYKHGLALPLHPSLTVEEVGYIAQKVKEAVQYEKK